MIWPDFWPPRPPWPVKKRPPSRRRRQDCMDCGVDTSFTTGIGHFYTVHTEVWRAAVPERECGELCLDCLEKRLGRKLTAADFISTPFEVMARFAGKFDLAEEAERARRAAKRNDKAPADHDET
jgi:hypothetical protein